VAFIRRERVPDPLPDGFWPAPDLAVEVLSPSNRVMAMQQKVLEYLESGTRVVWLVDPLNNVVTVYRTPSEARILHANELLAIDDVIPGFSLTVGELLEAI
jgi:Uma2 family endonuclease